MNITKLHTLTTALRDANNELCKVNRELETNVGKVVSDVEGVLWEISLQGFNLSELTSTMQIIKSLYKDSKEYDMDNSWFCVGVLSDLQGGDHETLQLRAYKLHTEQENKNIREVLLDTRSTLVTMCADYEKQIKEITNV